MTLIDLPAVVYMLSTVETERGKSRNLAELFPAFGSGKDYNRRGSAYCGVFSFFYVHIMCTYAIIYICTRILP